MKRLIYLVAFLCLTIYSYSYDFCENGFYFEKESSGNNVKIVAGDVPYSGSVVIPSVVSHEGETYVVITIGMQAFRNCNQLISVTIPSSVMLIDMYAFENCI